ncbi:hypothetical protein DO021_16560 [Desulfobacter hydrogenophilus]|uniref:DUF6603 domain-containing protein n=1 Tax=Desulfobacter hydrogenophilus TaxID=2291 RepID=A0A328F9I2_9BACT|nr:DUF6603 domain-containing protein [Desulfobacter hydrogenophilus]NDY73028.1 hypothetical protein [Desulfobacter hydrogenophilus]QBH14719.1 hypothetical protein EYB58_18425 [Desulfobacter hydrogenophilus]RAM00876.1 hypothetical protein DO021_16560 [Desulfobacter hydrogenophilus]
MAKTTTYTELLNLVTGLKAGDVFTVGPKDIVPDMLDSLSGLSLTFTLTVTSSSVDDATHTITVVGNATLFGIASMTASLEFSPKIPDTVSGPFIMSMNATPPSGTKWNLLPDFVISGMTVGFQADPETEVYSAFVGGDLVVGSDHPLSLPMQLDIPAYNDIDWSITGTVDKQPLSVDAFSALACGMNLSDYLPPPLNTLAKFGMSDFELAFNPSAGKLSYTYLIIEYSEPWSVLDVIYVQRGGVQLKFMVDFLESTNSYVELEAQFYIETVPVDIGAHFAPDDLIVWGRLQEGKSVNISDLFKHFNVTLPSGFPEVVINRLGVMVYLSSNTYSFDMQAQLYAGCTLKLNDLTAKVSVAKPSGEAVTNIDGNFYGTIVIDDKTTLFLEAKYDGEGGGLTLCGDAENIPIGSIITYWGNVFGITEVPKPISSLKIRTLSTQYNTSSGDFTFNCTGYFTIYKKPVEVTFSIDITHTKNGDERLESTIVGNAGYSATFAGSVKFANLEFDIKFNTQSGGIDIFIADYQHTGKDSEVRLKDLIAGVSKELASPIPEDISIGLKAVKFAFLEEEDKETKKKVKHFLFGVELGASIGLTSLPLIGDKLPKDATVEFNELQFAYSNPGFDKDQVALVNPLLPTGLIKLPKDGLAEGVLISTNLQLGDKNKTLSLTIPTGGSSEQEIIEAETNMLPVTAPASSSTPPVTLWMNVQKQFGPVGIQKIGLEYKDTRLFAVGDITLTAQVLTIGLLGVGIGSKINKFDPAATLDGLTITVAEGPLAISGGLYGSIAPLNFDGALMVEMPSMTVGALGGYAQKGYNPSFFMYLAIDRPLFGYPYFFLDGLAGGVGFNRDLMIPDIDGVASFPLVEWAMGTNTPGMNPSGNIAEQIDQVLGSLAADIPPKVGEYWIAAGIKFSSFKVLNSFALVTVAIGTDFKLALLGLTNASLPPNVGEGVPPIGYVEMALKVTFSPYTGILEVSAKLTPASYILTCDCHLTGGFAFFMWFKDNPDGDADSYHAGDFVVTLGGYNPAYKKPKYFPTEPLLGLNWQVDSHTTIKGGIYFAMTPSALMAGGMLEAAWHSGDLKAWFTAHADFLLPWKPFHYEAGIGLSIGVSYKLDLLFTSKTISVHLGVDLSLWGPSFGGKIYVDLTIISFTVNIGNTSKPSAKAISWSDFKTSFLPVNQATNTLLDLDTNSAIETDSYCLSSVSAGLVKDLSTSKASPNDPDWVVNAETLELVTMTALPTKTAKLISAGDKQSNLHVGSSDFGVGPVGIGIEDFASDHTITVNRIVDGAADTSFNLADHATIVPVTSNLPSGTWGGKLIINPSINDVNKTPAKIENLVVGYSIKMKPKEPDHTPLPIALSILQQECEGTIKFKWMSPIIPTTDSFDQSKSMQTFQNSLKAASDTRSNILNALNACGLDLDTTVDVDALAESADTVLWGPPVLSYLGEERAA